MNSPYKGIEVGTEVVFNVGDTEYKGKIVEGTRTPGYLAAKDSFLIMVEGKQVPSYIRVEKLSIIDEADKKADDDDKDDKDDKKDSKKDSKDSDDDDDDDKDDKKKTEATKKDDDDDDKDDKKDESAHDDDKEDDKKDDKKEESTDKDDKADDKDDKDDDDEKDDDKKDDKKKDKKDESVDDTDTTDTDTETETLTEGKLEEGSNDPEFIINYVTSFDYASVKLSVRNYKKVGDLRKEAMKQFKATNANASDDFWIDDIQADNVNVQDIDWVKVLAPMGSLDQAMVNRVFDEPEEAAIKIEVISKFVNNLNAKVIEDKWDEVTLYDAGRGSRVPDGYGGNFPQEWLWDQAEIDYPELMTGLQKIDALSYMMWERVYADNEANGKFSSDWFGDWFVTWNPTM